MTDLTETPAELTWGERLEAENVERIARWQREQVQFAEDLDRLRRHLPKKDRDLLTTVLSRVWDAGYDEAETEYTGSGITSPNPYREPPVQGTTGLSDEAQRFDTMSAESPPRKVYIVACGSYSDKAILSIWDDEKSAETVARSQGGYVEEWEMNTTRPATFRPWVARLDRHGNISVREADIDHSNTSWAESRVSAHGGGLDGVAWGRTEEHARKNLSDAIAKYKAEALEL